LKMTDTATELIITLSARSWLLSSLAGVTTVIYLFWDQVWILFLGLFLLPWKQVKTEISSYVARKELNEHLKRELNDYSYRTVLVYGSRGSGKSTLIKKFLEGKWVAIDVDVKEGDDVTERIALKLNTNKEYCNSERLYNMCHWCLWNDPFIVLSLDKVSADTFRDIISYCKTMSYDKSTNVMKHSFRRTPRFVVDLSLSRPALSRGINPLPYRFIPIKVGELSLKDATSYLKIRLEKFNTKDHTRLGEEMQKEIEKLKYYNILFLKNICDALDANVIPHIDAAKDIIKGSINAEVENYVGCWDAFSGAFLSYFKENDFSQKDALERLQTVGNMLIDAFLENDGTIEKDGTLKVIDIVKVLRRPDEEGKFVPVTSQVMSEWNARMDGNHLFDIDRIALTIGINGQLAFIALTQELTYYGSRQN